MPFGDGKCTARIEFTNSKEVEGADLDDVVTIVVKGKVKSLRGEEKRKEESYPIGKGKPKEREMLIPGCIEIEIEDLHVGKPSEWEEAAEKMEEDD